MWINPKYRDQVDRPAPPAETGQRLATFPRGDGAELRVSLAEYQGAALRRLEGVGAGAGWPAVAGEGQGV